LLAGLVPPRDHPTRPPETAPGQQADGDPYARPGLCRRPPAARHPATRAELRQSLALRQDPLAASLLGLLAAEPQAQARALGAPAASPPPDDWYLT
ncbi:MAG: hypothetical protein KA125_04090, partial [Chromatiaceae bacterium]|nr:hypothetical protein [Chromatiaceae bacterium]